MIIVYVFLDLIKNAMQVHDHSFFVLHREGFCRMFLLCGKFKDVVLTSTTAMMKTACGILKVKFDLRIDINNKHKKA